MDKRELPQAEPTNHNVGNYHSEQDLDLPDVPEVRSVRDILQSEGSFWDKAKATVRDTWFGRNTIGRTAGLLLDVAGLAFPRLDKVRRKGKRLLHQDERQFKYQPQQQNIMTWLVERLQERSTWRGLITGLTGLGVITLGEELRATIITAGVALFALAEIIIKDKKTTGD